MGTFHLGPGVREETLHHKGGRLTLWLNVGGTVHSGDTWHSHTGKFY